MINLEKSQSQETQIIEFLGFIINSKEMVFGLPCGRVKQIRDECKILQKDQVTVRELVHMVGLLLATHWAFLPAPLHYHALQVKKNKRSIPTALI